MATGKAEAMIQAGGAIGAALVIAGGSLGGRAIL